MEKFKIGDEIVFRSDGVNLTHRDGQAGVLLDIDPRTETELPYWVKFDDGDTLPARADELRHPGVAAPWPYKPAQPVQAEPYPSVLRKELAAVARAGGTVLGVEDLGDSIYRIRYVIPEEHSLVVDCPVEVTA